MRKLRYQRRQSRSAVWALRLGIFALVLLAMAFLLHRFWTLETPDLVLLAGLSTGLAALALLCSAKGFRNLWVNGDKGGARSFWGGIFALPCYFQSDWSRHCGISLHPSTTSPRISRRHRNFRPICRHACNG